jgi:hypothetical protein
MGCSWFNTETNKRKTSINNKNMHQKPGWRFGLITGDFLSTVFDACFYC